MDQNIMLCVNVEILKSQNKNNLYKWHNYKWTNSGKVSIFPSKLTQVNLYN